MDNVLPDLLMMCKCWKLIIYITVQLDFPYLIILRNTGAKSCFNFIILPLFITDISEYSESVANFNIQHTILSFN